MYLRRSRQRRALGDLRRLTSTSRDHPLSTCGVDGLLTELIRSDPEARNPASSGPERPEARIAAIATNARRGARPIATRGNRELSAPVDVLSSSARLAHAARSTPRPRLSSIRATPPRRAGLTYVSDEEPGIRRKKAGKGFTYLKPDGAKVDGRGDAGAHQVARHPAGLDRCVDLPARPTAISRRPAATPRAASSTATIRDFREVRESTKYEHMLDFARGLPAIRETHRRAHGACAACRARRCWRRSCTCSRTR